MITTAARAALPAMLAVGVAAAMLSGCGAAATAHTKITADSGGSACDRVSAVLAGGPNSVTDPVGYARSRVPRLRDVKTTNARLRAAIDRLADAYVAFSASKGDSAAKAAVAAAGQQITTLCPPNDDQ